MKSIRIHNNQIAINVKREPRIDFTEAQEAGIRENRDFFDSQWWDQVAVQCNIVEKYLRKRFPSFDIRVSIAGRSGGWCEMSGNWGQIFHDNADLDSEPPDGYRDYTGNCLPEHKHSLRLLTGFIIPLFEREVDAALARFKEWCLSFVDGLSMAVCDDCGGVFPSDDITGIDVVGEGCPSDYVYYCPVCLENARKLDPNLEIEGGGEMTTREKLSLVSQMDSFLRDCCRDTETVKDFDKLDAAKLEKLRQFKRLTEQNKGRNEMKTWQIKYKEADHMDADRFMLFNLNDSPLMAPRRVVYREWLAANPACLFRAYADSGSDEFGERGYSDLSGPEWLRWFDLRNKH